MDLQVPLVIDNGSGVVKAGKCDAEDPETFLSVVGRLRNPGRIKHSQYTVLTNLPVLDNEEVFVGEEVELKRALLKLKHPMGNGIVSDWFDMRKIWDYTFKRLQVNPELHPVLLTEPALNPKKNREQMAEIMFEEYKIPALYISVQAVLSLYAYGKTTGVVLDSGDGVTHIVPIYETYSMPHAIQRLNLAGRDLTGYLKYLLTEDGVYYSSTAETDIARSLKEQFCYVTDHCGDLNLDPGFKNSLFVLPDGKEVSLQGIKHKCPEALFDPLLLGKDLPGIHEALIYSINKCDLDIRKQLYGNIVLSGGTCKLPGIKARLYKELTKLAPGNIDIKIDAKPVKDRQKVVWLGGAILASMSSFKNIWISQEEYKEFGVGRVHTKCF